MASVYLNVYYYIKRKREVVDHAIIKTLLMINGGLAKIGKNDSV